MTSRSIVRNTEIASGRWHFQDSAIFIDDIRRDAITDKSGARDSYRTLGVSDAEFDDAMSFSFPEVNTAEVEASLHSVTIHCSCGIVRFAAIDPESLVSDLCPCGRRWQLSIGIEERP